MNYKKFGEAILLTDSQILEVVNEHWKSLDTSDILNMIEHEVNKIKQSGEEEKFLESAPIDKYTYIAARLYMDGFLMGLVMLNDSLKESLDEMQIKKAERLAKKGA